MQYLVATAALISLSLIKYYGKLMPRPIKLLGHKIATKF